MEMSSGHGFMLLFISTLPSQASGLLFVAVMDGLAGKAHKASLFLFKKMCVSVIELAPIL